MTEIKAQGPGCGQDSGEGLCRGLKRDETLQVEVLAR